MAGYLFLIGGENGQEILERTIRTGCHSAFIGKKYNRWINQFSGTMADYLSMKEGERVYFFTKRKIYGVGKMVKVAGIDCKFENFEGANSIEDFENVDVSGKALLNFGADTWKSRWFCTFEPDPAFYASGLDMDEALSSSLDAFKMLPALQGTSFTKFDDKEDEALFQAIMSKNKQTFMKGNPPELAFRWDGGETHRKLASNPDLPKRLVSAIPLAIAKGMPQAKRLVHEGALEAILIEKLASKDPATVEVFGDVDYLNHQVIASPKKPVEFSDWMDIFGTKMVSGLNGVVNYHVLVELKDEAATLDVVDQVMKYVDWVNRDYCKGEYSLIRAFIVASDFSDDVKTHAKKFCIRNYTVGFKPSEHRLWNDLKLIKYQFDPKTQTLSLKAVA